MSHTASRSWVSADVQDRERFLKLRELIRHLVPDSPFPPKTLQDFITHKQAILEEAKTAMIRRLKQREAQRKLEKQYGIGITKIKPAFNRKVPKDFRGAVLSQVTMWVAHDEIHPNRPRAPWPEFEELKHEGDDRNKSSYGRFLPLPRKPGNETVNWKAREMLRPLSPMDTVGPSLRSPYPEMGPWWEDPEEFLKIVRGFYADPKELEDLNNKLMELYAGRGLMEAING